MVVGIRRRLYSDPVIGELARDVDDALAQLSRDITAADTGTADAALTAHISDTTDAHAASAVTFTPDGDIAATDVQAAIKEVRDDTDTKLSGKASTSHTHAASALVSGTIDTARLGSGVASASKYLRGDQTWAAVSSATGAATGHLRWAPPPIAHAMDEEFNETNTVGAGVIGGGASVLGTINPYAAAVGSGLYDVNVYRQSCLCFQASTTVGFQTIEKTYASYPGSVAPTNHLVYTRAWASQQPPGLALGQVNLWLALTNNAWTEGVYLRQFAYNTGGTAAYDIVKQSGGVWTTVVSSTYSPLGHFGFGIQKIGTTYWFFSYGEDGLTRILGSTTFATAPQMCAIYVERNPAAYSTGGCQISVIDFLRFRDSADWMP